MRVFLPALFRQLYRWICELGGTEERAVSPLLIRTVGMNAALLLGSSFVSASAWEKGVGQHRGETRVL